MFLDPKEVKNAWGEKIKKNIAFIFSHPNTQPCQINISKFSKNDTNRTAVHDIIIIIIIIIVKEKRNMIWLGIKRSPQEEGSAVRSENNKIYLYGLPEMM